MKKVKRAYVRKKPYERKSSTFTPAFFKAAFFSLILIEAYFLIKAHYGR